MRLHVGEKVKICGGSGVNSGKVGIVIPRSQVPTKQTSGGIIPDLPGYYKPVDWAQEIPLRLEDGKIITMYEERLTRVS